MSEILKFDLPRNQSSIIKVIGVGGGGSNAVNHMFQQGIKGVDFIICNTDAQAMESSPVPTRIQLGTNLTEGLGAGASPTVGRNAALENAEDIRNVFSKGTKMLFITAGLGGGTGTGAAPVIAQIARELDILTVGIVTIPFAFEGRKRRQAAEDGIRQLKQHVDALLIISNDKLRLLCGDLPLSEAFKKADNVLTTAARGIAEIITVVGYINVDFEDVKTVMKNSGVAIMGTGVACGPDRASKAVEEALNSPLLDNNDITGAGNLLLYITSGRNEITMDEVTEITDYIQTKTNSTGDVIWGNGFDESLDDQISVTIIATGFDEDHKQKDPSKPVDVTVHTLYDTKPAPIVEQRVPAPDPMLRIQPASPIPATPLYQNDPIPAATPETEELIAQPAADFTPAEETTEEPVIEMIENEADEAPAFEITPQSTEEDANRNIEFLIRPPEPEAQPVRNTGNDTQPVRSSDEPGIRVVFKPEPEITAAPVTTPNEHHNRKAEERVSKLRQLSEKLKTHTPIENNLQELENIPAYKRRNVELAEVTPSSEPAGNKYVLSGGAEGSVEIRTENSYLHTPLD